MRRSKRYKKVKWRPCSTKKLFFENQNFTKEESSFKIPSKKIFFIFINELEGSASSWRDESTSHWLWIYLYTSCRCKKNIFWRVDKLDWITKHVIKKKQGRDRTKPKNVVTLIYISPKRAPIVFKHHFCCLVTHSWSSQFDHIKKN